MLRRGALPALCACLQHIHIHAIQKSVCLPHAIQKSVCLPGPPPHAALGFTGAKTILAPYAAVPPGAELTYEVELLRLSARGPDELTLVSEGLVRVFFL